MRREPGHVDALLVSTGRAASTAVYQYLSEMGDLALPANKEPHHFVDLSKYGGRYALLDGIHVPDPADYQRLYERSRIVLDASVGYFFCIDEVLQRLASAGQRPRVVFLYREPLSRAASFFHELRKKGLEPHADLHAALAARKPPGLWWEHYYDNVAYDDVHRRIAAALPVLAVDHRAIRHDVDATMRRICEFLRIEPVRRIRYRKVNSSAEARLQARLGRLYHRLPGPLRKAVGWLAVKGDEARAEPADRRDLAPYLPASVAQYRALCRRLQDQAIHDSEHHV